MCLLCEYMVLYEMVSNMRCIMKVMDIEYVCICWKFMNCVCEDEILYLPLLLKIRYCLLNKLIPKNEIFGPWFQYSIF